MRRVIAIALASLLNAAAGDFAVLNLKVVEGEGMTYALGSRATRGVTVEITDESGRPLADVAVSFRLPEEGPTGTFSNGTRTDVVTTKQDGRATIWGMKWNRTAGDVALRITAAKSGVRAGIISAQHLSATAELAKSTSVSHGGSHTKLLYVALAVAGAAGGGIAFGMARKPSTAAVSPTVPLSVGNPSVIVGAP